MRRSANATHTHTHARMKNSKGTAPCPFCSRDVNNFNIRRHLREHHKVGSGGAQTATPLPNYESSSTSSSSSSSSSASSSSDAESGHQCSTSISDSALSSSSSSSDESDGGGNDSADEENDEAEIDVEHYLRNMTDEALRNWTEIKYEPKRVLKYLSWAKRTLTPIEHEALRFLRCASFGHGVSKAHANEWLAYERDFGGRAALLPKHINTVWRIIGKAHRDMSDDIMRKTVVFPIPIAVHCMYIFIVNF